MADETEIVKLKTIVNLKSRQAGFRAKKRCGRGESRVTEGRGRRNLRQGRKGRRETRGGAAMRREEKRRVRAAEWRRKSRGGEAGDGCAGGKMQRVTAPQRILCRTFLPCPSPKIKVLGRGMGARGKGDSPFSKGCHPSPAISFISLSSSACRRGNSEAGISEGGARKS